MWHLLVVAFLCCGAAFAQEFRSTITRGNHRIPFLLAGIVEHPGFQKAEHPGIRVSVGSDGLDYVWIPPGTFMMGCSPGDSECEDDEKPAHRVIISKGFQMGRTEVTVGAYKRFVAATGRAMPTDPKLGHRSLSPGWGNERQPMSTVTRADAAAYCQWAGGRLPTEAEWEYAARGGTAGARYGDLDAVAWYADNSGRSRLDSASLIKQGLETYALRLNANHNGPHEVGQKAANGFGLYDMLGNVWEWVADWYGMRYYGQSPAQDPRGPSSGEARVLRSGSCLYCPRYVRASHRYWVVPGLRSDDIGFRCVREVP